MTRDAVQRFAEGLRTVWAAAGSPSYRRISSDLEARGRFHGKSTVGDVLQGIRLPKPEMLRDLVDYLQGDVGEWSDRLALLLVPEGHDAEPPGAGTGLLLPNQVVDFVGRRAELAELDRLLAGGTRRTAGRALATVLGPGGIGKTALAVHWAHRNAGRFPDGQLYVDLRGFGPEPPLSPAVVVLRFLTALGVAASAVPSDVDGQFSLYRSLMATRKVLLVLDNAENSDQVLPLLPDGPDCAVVVTSRTWLGTLALRGARPLNVGVFDDDEARRFLAERLDGRNLEVEPEVVTALLEKCAGLPLALGIVAARAANQPHLPLSALAEELEDTATRLDALDIGEVDGNLRQVFSWSYRSLSPAVAQAFRLLSVAPGADVSLPAAAALLDQTTRQARSALRRLVAAHLVSEPVPSRYTMHDLVRLFAGEQLDTPAERLGAARRVCQWYLTMADSADRVVAPHRNHVLPDGATTAHLPAFGGYDEAWRWYEAEHSNLAAATRLAATTDLADLSWRLSLAAFGYYRTSQNWREWQDMQRTALIAARRAGSSTGQAWVLNALGIAQTALGEHEEATASYEQALAIRKAIGDVVGEGQVLNNLGELFRRMGRYQDAIECMQADIDICRRVDDQYGHVIALNNLGKILLDTGRAPEALDAQRRALAICDEIGDPHSETEIRNDLGDIHQRLNEPETARLHYQSAADQSRARGDLITATRALMGLSEIALNVGDIDSAAGFALQASEIAGNASGAIDDELAARIRTMQSRLAEERAG